MNANKRKLKDNSTPAKHKSEGKSVESDTSYANIPIIRSAENETKLPTYAAVLAKNSNDGVNMDDLDQLQQDLEKMLSTNAVRLRWILNQISSNDKKEPSKRIQSHNKAPAKRRRVDKKVKHKEKVPAPKIKKQYLPVNSFTDVKQEIPKITLPKNDNSDQFWASIEPFCTNVNRDDLAFLDNLIEEFSKEPEFSIPEVGQHYSYEWSDELLNEELGLSRSPKSKVVQNVEIKKNGLSTLTDAGNGQSQSALSANLEARIRNLLPSSADRQKIEGGGKNGNRVGLCLEKRLKRTLADQGLLSKEQVQNESSDEILLEIKKCQQDLTTINEHNLNELTKLRKIVISDLKKQTIKDQLEKVDKQVLDLYNKIMVDKKQAKISLLKDCFKEGGGEGIDKESLAQQITKENIEIDNILRQQNELQKQLNELSKDLLS